MSILFNCISFRCKCNGHTDSCIYSPTSSACQCMHNTQGDTVSCFIAKLPMFLVCLQCSFSPLFCTKLLANWKTPYLACGKFRRDLGMQIILWSIGETIHCSCEV